MRSLAVIGMAAIVACGAQATGMCTSAAPLTAADSKTTIGEPRYLPLRWLRDLHWGKFGLSLAGLGSFGACIYSVMRGFYQYALWGIAAVWVLSISGSIIWGRKHEE